MIVASLIYLEILTYISESMAQYYRKIAVLAPWKRFLIQRQYQQPVRNFWNFRGPFPSDFRSLMRDMERTMERMERGFDGNFPFKRFTPGMIPIKGIEKFADTFRMNVDVDGFKPEEITISLKDNVLTIHAKMDRSAEDGSKYHQEFTRELTLPENVDIADLKAFLEDGVIRLESSYKTPEKPKEIPVNKN